VIVLDTHVWIWWVHNDPLLPEGFRLLLEQGKASGLGVSAFSCWEVAKLVERSKLILNEAIDDWMAKALGPSWINLLPLTPEIAIESTRLPQPFHKDPADQIIVATARAHNCPLASCDALIRAYPHVQHLL
jgi:PIN domain nuclease of toxin-antitoxin system